MNEFEIIHKYFRRKHNRNDIIVDSGDDAAVLQPPKGQQLVTSIDALVSGVHFPENTDPADIGYKAIAVSLSDMAAMAAEPAWVLATLTMPEVDESWIKRFCDGFYAQFKEYNLALVGGDLTRGPLAISTQIMGFVPEGKAITRGGAKSGDLIYVTGTLGDAAMGLKAVKSASATSSSQFFIHRLNRPTARVKEGIEIRNIATAAVDVSDGLVQDLGHILKASGVGAVLNIEKIPLSEHMKSYIKETNNYDYVLAGGDDFELCFTAPKHVQCHYPCVGEITASTDLRLHLNDQDYTLNYRGYNHFIN